MAGLEAANGGLREHPWGCGDESLDVKSMVDVGYQDRQRMGVNDARISHLGDSRWLHLELKRNLENSSLMCCSGISLCAKGVLALHPVQFHYCGAYALNTSCSKPKMSGIIAVHL